MSLPYPLTIDAYSHIVPPKYNKTLLKVSPQEHAMKVASHHCLFDLDARFRMMDHYGQLVQVITLGWPPIEDIATGKQVIDLTKSVNDEIAELVYKYPERFVAGIAHLPMTDMNAALKELDRAILDLRLRGIQIYSPVRDKPLDSPEFIPLYEKMCQYDLPIFIHPMRAKTYSDYRTEKESMYAISGIFGWPYETTTAMARLVFSGMLERFPNLKIITHHCGGMVPYYADRIAEFSDSEEMRYHAKRNISKAPLDYFRKFYADTAVYGNPSALTCGWTFFGPDHIVFGVDSPLGDSQDGYRNYRNTLNAIEQMEISDEDKEKILCLNAKKIMRLTI
jgi:predicted TIM-barrel fold metal-dependent hydrolase